MEGNRVLLRAISRRGNPRRFVGLCVLAAVLVAAPGAVGTPGDPTPPVITPVIFGTLGAKGWYISNVTINWQVVDPESVILSSPGCGATTLATDTLGTKLTCTATSDGGESSVSKTFQIDKTPPAVTAAASRAPDANGWYNHALTVTFSGTDATSKLESCVGGSYSGPDNPAAAVAGSCRDNAGNVTPSALPFKYDSTPPSVAAVSTKRGNRMAQFSWRASADTKLVEIARAPGRKGAGQSIVYTGAASSYRDSGLRAGRNYRYRITGFDDAQNRVDQTLTFTASGRLLTPAPGEKVKLGSRTVMTWTRAKKAAYYNLQLIRGGKVLSVWPVRTSFQLPRSWVYQGRRYRLRPGVYRWYVWPGIGRISANRYGRLLGSSSFTVTR
jgi:hypothetical protein